MYLENNCNLTLWEQSIAAGDLTSAHSTRWNEGSSVPLLGHTFQFYGMATSWSVLPNGVASMNVTGTGLFIPNVVIYFL